MSGYRGETRIYTTPEYYKTTFPKAIKTENSFFHDGPNRFRIDKIYRARIETVAIEPVKFWMTKFVVTDPMDFFNILGWKSATLWVDIWSFRGVHCQRMDNEVLSQESENPQAISFFTSLFIPVRCSVLEFPVFYFQWKLRFLNIYLM